MTGQMMYLKEKAVKLQDKGNVKEALKILTQRYIMSKIWELMGMQ